MRNNLQWELDLKFLFLLHVLELLVHDESDSSNTEVKEGGRITLKETISINLFY